MELEQKQLTNDLNEPFEIVRNARKNSKQFKAIPSKVRKNSTISLGDEKNKKIKKKSRKLTEYLDKDGNWMDQLNELTQKKNNPIEKQNWQSFIESLQDVSKKQSIKGEEKEMDQECEDEKGFQFQDHEGEKCILEGIGDENSLGRQFNFDFFNPEKFSG